MSWPGGLYNLSSSSSTSCFFCCLFFCNIVPGKVSRNWDFSPPWFFLYSFWLLIQNIGELAGDAAQCVECLSSIHKVLSLVPNTEERIESFSCLSHCWCPYLTCLVIFLELYMWSCIVDVSTWKSSPPFKTNKQSGKKLNMEAYPWTSSVEQLWLTIFTLLSGPLPPYPEFNDLFHFCTHLFQSDWVSLAGSVGQELNVGLWFWVLQCLLIFWHLCIDTKPSWVCWLDSMAFKEKVPVSLQGRASWGAERWILFFL